MTGWADVGAKGQKENRKNRQRGVSRKGVTWGGRLSPSLKGMRQQPSISTWYDSPPWDGCCEDGGGEPLAGGKGMQERFACENGSRMGIQCGQSLAKKGNRRGIAWK